MILENPTNPTQKLAEEYFSICGLTRKFETTTRNIRYYEECGLISPQLTNGFPPADDGAHIGDTNEQWEWWYFDFSFDNCCKAVVTFHYHNMFLLPHLPTMQLFIYPPDAPTVVKMWADGQNQTGWVIPKRLRLTCHGQGIDVDGVLTTCGVGRDEFAVIMQSCLMGGHMRVGLEDNVRVPNGDMARGNYELVEWAVRAAQVMGREPATPDEARQIMGLGKRRE